MKLYTTLKTLDHLLTYNNIFPRKKKTSHNYQIGSRKHFNTASPFKTENGTSKSPRINTTPTPQDDWLIQLHKPHYRTLCKFRSLTVVRHFDHSPREFPFLRDKNERWPREVVNLRRPWLHRHSHRHGIAINHRIVGWHGVINLAFRK